MGFIGVSGWVLLKSVPQYEDLWLVLIGVIGAGAVGAWRADIAADEQRIRDERELVVRAIDDTLLHVQRTHDFYFERDRAAREGRSLPSPIDLPLYVSADVAGEAEAIIEWLRVDAEFNRFEPRLSVAELRRLNDAALAMRTALLERRSEIASGRRRSRLTDEEQTRVSGVFAEMQVLQETVTNQHIAQQGSTPSDP
jgi:hypothetical protein